MKDCVVVSLLERKQRKNRRWSSDNEMKGKGLKKGGRKHGEFGGWSVRTSRFTALRSFPKIENQPNLESKWTWEGDGGFWHIGGKVFLEIKLQN